ncbi:hypothetical protein ABPG72_022124 [Tetrahymena utriculariae]
MPLNKEEKNNITIVGKTIIVLLQLNCLFKYSIAATKVQIQNCEAQSSHVFGYEQCIDCSQNCSLCNGTVNSSNVCQIPTASSCLLPGFLYNAQNVCVDCRIQSDCLNNCNGYWDPTLNTCIRQANSTFKVQGGKSCLSLTSQTDCQMCVDQKYGWSSSLQKCLKCPSGSTWSAATMTCSQISNCDFSQLLGYNSQTGSCSGCSSPYFLNQYSYSCEKCSSNCSCTTAAYSSCDANSCVAPYTQTSDQYGSFCECKGATFFNGTTCQSCSSNCLKCDTNGQCLQCSNGQLIDKATFQCVNCAVPSPNPLYCDIKVFAYCSQLTSDGKYCNSCIQNLIYDPVQKYCICPNGGVFSTSQSTCVSCSTLFPNCGKCDSYQCTACLDTTFTLASDSQSCLCQGYVQNGTCVPCTNSLKNCAQCDPTGKTCLSCIPNFGLITSTNSCYACSGIDKNCISCDANNTCLACTNGYTLQASTNTCVCDISQTKFVVINSTCMSCQTASPNCLQCSLNSTSNAVVCTTCNSPYVVSNGTCQLCAAGSYRSGNSCVACSDSNCSQCNSSGCYSCTNGYTLTQNSCTCTTAGYIIDTADKKCKTCASKFNSSLCQNCNSTQCTQCGGTGFTPTSTGCTCQNGIQIPNTTVCQPCEANCSVCTLNLDNVTTTCTQCSSNYRLMANNTCQQCSSGQYYDKSSMSCNSCNANCSACPDNQGGASCTACSNNYVLNSTIGTCTCPSTIIDSNNQCVSCSTNYNQYCSTCNQSQCLTCQNNYYLQGSTFNCIQCPSNKYFQAGTVNDCVSCPANCTACAALTGICTGNCLNNYDLVNGTCQCMGANVLNSLNQCVSCSTLLTNCSICSSATTCTKCTTPYYLLANGTCGSCSSTQYYQTSSLSCVNCPANCTACTNDTGACTGACLNNYKLVNGACICSSDRALDSSSNCQLCTALFPNCSQCNSSACTQCFAPFTVGDKGQCRICTDQETYVSSSFTCQLCSSFIKNCSSCSSSSQCSKCSGNFTPSSDNSSCVCPAGFYLIPGDPKNNIADQCIQCSSFDSNCKQCSGLNACTLCADKYAFDSSMQKCRTCFKNEFYNYNQTSSVQQCANCNSIHSQCTACISSTQCTQCINNYDLLNNPQQSSCQCSGNKILVPSPQNVNVTSCLLCSQVVDPNCQNCSVANKCDNCLPNYRWDNTYNRCIPNITLQLTSSSGNNYALADNFTLTFMIPEPLIDFQFNITTYFFDSVDQYNTEVQLLSQYNISSLDAPFNFQNCYVYFQDNLKNKSNINYKLKDSGNQSTLVRTNNFLLHNGMIRFVYAVESLNNSFQRYAINYDLQIVSKYTNASDLAYYMGPQIETFDQFSLYNVFFELLLMQNTICISDSQCLNNGSCMQAQKLCQCKANFQLFDCSDYQTTGYDLVIKQVSKSLLSIQPKNYQEKIISSYLPLLVTASMSQNYSGLNYNIFRIQSIIKQGSLDSTQQNEIQLLMKDAMNIITSAITNLDPNFTPKEIYSSIQQLFDLNDQLLPLFNNYTSFVTNSMQIMGQVSKSSNPLSISISSSNLFKPSFNATNLLFQQTNGTTGSPVKVLFYAFQQNPHKLATPQFITQPNNYPLIIMNTQQASHRILSQNNSTVSPYTPYNQNFTFIFLIANTEKLQNPICLSLTDMTADNYVLCKDIQILSGQVICVCQNSATLYEDIYYNYTPDPNKTGGSGENISTSYVIAIVVLSVILGLLIYVQIRNRKRFILEQKQKEQERLEQQQTRQQAKKEVTETQAEKNIYRKSSEMTMNTQNYEIGFQSPILQQKDVRLTLFENSPEQLYQQDCVIQDQFELEQKHDEESATNQRSIDIQGILSPRLIQVNDDKSTPATAGLKAHQKFKLAKQVQ